MIYTIPDYYQEFACIAGDCPDTCCAGWQIVIDEKSQRKYKKYPGEFGKRLKSSVDWKEGIFRQREKRCEFLNEENLCDIYINSGPHMHAKEVEHSDPNLLLMEEMLLKKRELKLENLMYFIGEM